MYNFDLPGYFLIFIVIIVVQKYCGMQSFQCAICLANQDSQLPIDFVPCVLNCSHMFCLKCVIAAITQCNPPGEDGKAYAIEDSDKCPLCRNVITSIIPLSPMVSSDQAYAEIKYYNEIVNNPDLDDDLVKVLRRHKSNICGELNQLCSDLVQINRNPKLLSDLIVKHKLFLESEFIVDYEHNTISFIDSNITLSFT
jgi:hypothetical protein